MRATWAAAALAAALSLTAATAATAAPANPPAASDAPHVHSTLPLLGFAPPASLFTAGHPPHSVLPAAPGAPAAPNAPAAAPNAPALPAGATPQGLDLSGVLDALNQLIAATPPAGTPDPGDLQKIVDQLTGLIKGLLGQLLPALPPT